MDGQRGVRLLRQGPSGAVSGGRMEEQVANSPIYLRAKFVGATHISMSISGIVDTVLSMVWFVDVSWNGVD